MFRLVCITLRSCRNAIQRCGDGNMLRDIDHEQSPASPTCAHAKLSSHATDNERRGNNVAVQTEICCERLPHNTTLLKVLGLHSEISVLAYCSCYPSLGLSFRISDPPKLTSAVSFEPLTRPHRRSRVEDPDIAWCNFASTWRFCRWLCILVLVGFMTLFRLVLVFVFTIILSLAFAITLDI